MMRDTVTITREAWYDMHAYIERLEGENKSLKEDLEQAYANIEELVEVFNAANS